MTDCYFQIYCHILLVSDFNYFFHCFWIINRILYQSDRMDWHNIKSKLAYACYFSHSDNTPLHTNCIFCKRWEGLSYSYGHTDDSCYFFTNNRLNWIWHVFPVGYSGFIQWYCRNNSFGNEQLYNSLSHIHHWFFRDTHLVEICRSKIKQYIFKITLDSDVTS